MSAGFDWELPENSQWDQLLDSIVQITNRAIMLFATEFWGNIRRESPVDHGRLAGSFILEEVSPGVWRIVSGVEYAQAVWHGTDPHDIVPVNKQALWWPGASHPVKRVRHPGTAGDDFPGRAMTTTEGRGDEFIRRAIREFSNAA